MKKPEDILKEWMQAVNNGDVEALIALYNADAVLIPTFSNRLLSKPESIRDYFEKLCGREELSIALHEKTLITHFVSNTVHAMHGIYCWRFAIDGELLSFEARFSYVIDLGRPRPILHHHSSQIPRML
ncbi:DUF4440 domain-containing protein [Propionivibrio sp.]|uniref:DUF4440 domain-containing protein n=1 Tax=Propionivibrio sp. TaxID=2212460 RepID=UPI00260D5B15|nr:DUF4440 domain-containing protein [Propionivibrio sp.]